MNDKDMAHLRAETGYDFSGWAGHAVKAVADAFRVLQRIQYGRPWDRLANPRPSGSPTCR